MIPILISGKKYQIKTISELTTAEFILLSDIPELDTVKYIAWQTGLSFSDAFFAVTSKAVEMAIGVAPDIQKLPRPKGFDYSKLIDTVGQRHQIENSGKVGFPLLVYCLAVSQARSNNSDHVAELEAGYLSRPFAEILPAGFFFFQNYRDGKKRGLSFLNLRQFLIRIKNLRNLRVWRLLIPTRIT